MFHLRRILFRAQKLRDFKVSDPDFRAPQGIISKVSPHCPVLPCCRPFDLFLCRKVVADLWRNASPETKRIYGDLAEQCRVEHTKKYPSAFLFVDSQFVQRRAHTHTSSSQSTSSKCVPRGFVSRSKSTNPSPHHLSISRRTRFSLLSVHLILTLVHFLPTHHRRALLPPRLHHRCSTTTFGLNLNCRRCQRLIEGTMATLSLLCRAQSIMCSIHQYRKRLVTLLNHHGAQTGRSKVDEARKPTLKLSRRM